LKTYRVKKLKFTSGHIQKKLNNSENKKNCEIKISQTEEVKLSLRWWGPLRGER